MFRSIIVLSAAAALMALPQFAFADGDGVVTGVVGGAVAGAVVGGPVGAVVGGAAGGVIGGEVSGPNRDRVVVQPVAPCNSRTTETTDSKGNGSATRTTNCAD